VINLGFNLINSEKGKLPGLIITRSLDEFAGRGVSKDVQKLRYGFNQKKLVERLNLVFTE
jgi:hypothetical protein